MLPLKIIIFYLPRNDFKIPIGFPRAEYWYLPLLERHASPCECLQMLPKLAIFIIKLPESKLIILNSSYRQQWQFWSLIQFPHRMTALLSISNSKMPVNNTQAIKGLKQWKESMNALSLDLGRSYEERCMYVKIHCVVQLRLVWLSISML